MGREERLREQAIRRHRNGETIAAICASLGRSRQWFYRWWKRYQSGEADWYRTRSRRPKRHGRAIGEQLEAAILASRARLEAAGLFCGAQAIRWDLEDAGMADVPCDRTIARVISRRDRCRRRTGRYRPKGTKYPKLAADEPGQLQQTDFVGPCYLTGGVRFYSLHSIDAAINRCAVQPVVRRCEVAEAIWNCWLRIGLPVYQQVDNEWVFFGSPRHPRGMGKLIRLCLWQGVEPVFIPPGEPWRNGVVEKFNDHWRSKFYQRVSMADLPALCSESLAYENRHNARYRYSKLGGRTPDQVLKDRQASCRYPGSERPPAKLKKPETGRYHLVRLIRSDGLLDVFTEKFPMPPETVYEYVVATVDVERQKLEIRLAQRQIEEIDYRLD